MSLLFRPIDIASLVFIRIAVGILACVDVANTLGYYHLQVDAFHPDRFQFRYLPFEWLPTFHDPWMSLLLGAISLMGLFVALGLWYRVSTVLLFLGFTYVYLLEKATYLNHGYLFCWICFVMIFLPAHRAFSVDVWRRPALHRRTVPAWTTYSLVFMMSVVYIFGGIAKLNGDWLRAVPLLEWMDYRSKTSVVGTILAEDWVAWVMAYTGLLLDLFVVVFLLMKRTRPYAFAAVILFHLLNMLIFNIGIFPWLSVSLTALFFPPSWPRLLVQWMSQKWKWAASWKAAWSERLSDAGESLPLWQESPAVRIFGVPVMLMFAWVHLLLPLRHHLYPGPVAWTEEGHRYSWRMMLRQKTGYGSFIVRDPVSGWSVRIRPEDHLWNKQSRKLRTHPDMVLQYAHHLRDRYRDEYPEVEVYAPLLVRLNDGKTQPYIDPECDLAKEEWSFWKHSDWIVELAE